MFNFDNNDKAQLFAYFRQYDTSWKIKEPEQSNIWEKCPVCNGTGNEGSYPMKSPGSIEGDCTVCEGKKIISKMTGKPPKN